MSDNYIKIELLSKSTPMITMEYEDLESFQNLVFFLISDSGSDLFVKTIEQQLIKANKTKELEILRAFSEFIFTAKNKNLTLKQNDVPVIKPSSFSGGIK